MSVVHVVHGTANTGEEVAIRGLQHWQDDDLESKSKCDCRLH